MNAWCSISWLVIGSWGCAGVAVPDPDAAGLPAPLPLPLSGSVLGKRSAEPPLTPAASVDAGEALDLGDAASAPPPSDEVQEPPKKKRRAVLTRVSELDP